MYMDTFDILCSLFFALKGQKTNYAPLGEKEKKEEEKKKALYNYKTTKSP